MTFPLMPPFSPTLLVVGEVAPGAVEVTVAQKLVALTGRAGLQAAYGALPKSIQLPWLVIPDQPSAQTHGGSMRPVEAVDELAMGVPATNEALSAALQSAVAQ